MQGGLSGRGSSGAGLGLNAPLRFGVLMENCASPGPNCSDSGSERGLGPQPGWERENNAVKRTVMNRSQESDAAS